MWFYLTFLVMLKLGEIAYSGHYLRYFLDSLGWVFCGGIVAFVIVATIRRRRNHPIARRTATLIPPSMAAMAARTKRAGIAASKTLLFIAIGALFGWLGRDRQLVTNTMTFRHVKVVSKVSDKRFYMQPAGMKIYDWEFCHAITPPAAVVDIKFEQRNGCKQIIGVGFLEISREDNNYVQIGRNSTTATTAP